MYACMYACRVCMHVCMITLPANLGTKPSPPPPHLLPPFLLPLFLLPPFLPLHTPPAPPPAPRAFAPSPTSAPAWPSTCRGSPAPRPLHQPARPRMLPGGGVACHAMARHGMAWHGMPRHGSREWPVSQAVAESGNMSPVTPRASFRLGHSCASRCLAYPPPRRLAALAMSPSGLETHIAQSL